MSDKVARRKFRLMRREYAARGYCLGRPCATPPIEDLKAIGSEHRSREHLGNFKAFFPPGVRLLVLCGLLLRF